MRFPDVRHFLRLFAAIAFFLKHTLARKGVNLFILLGLAV